ncbi:mannan endo-1,6-alpha-mannosidase [Aspergillus heteromorphus CBS 117.55]|uniref:Mannan endo-1,6-alpha-mannosidase n=1 Tax=Aspergillus heteromorphus CBS 117.55 TaxID=1448321 RepID=A0A317WNY7_9EURO|nr:mannan endo-1,6-alpha-mannosidase [Aspergillus heteromorphus CBS 117.55]PWY88204.1 mannan endo-1,6-alpha-mannosidase [Aspergillus heteromorphus CBS 117.55]
MVLLTNRLAGAFTVALAGSASAISLDINNEQSIRNAAATASFNTMSNYTSNHTGQIPGYIPDAWWEGGALFDTLIQYWYFTGDASNNPAVSQGMYWQRGNDNYMPSNWSSYMSNVDQMAWGLAAMTAAELNYPVETNMSSWQTLAQRVFKVQSARWDESTCGGGLRWQIWSYESGYTMKTAASNGGLFQLSARLARFTGNQTYADWAEKIWDWSLTSLVNNDTWVVADSTSTGSGCATVGENQWTYNYGLYLSGLAYMYNFTNGETKWKAGLNGLLNTTFTNFFPEKYGGMIMSEALCEPAEDCNTSEETYKGLLAGDLAFVSVVAPYTASEIIPRLQGSASGAAKQCSGGSNETLCGRRWYQTTWDGSADMEEQMSATSIFASNLVVYKDAGLATQATATNATTTEGGTGAGNGTSSTDASGGGNGTVTGVTKNAGSTVVCGALGVVAAIVAGAVAVA